MVDYFEKFLFAFWFCDLCVELSQVQYCNYQSYFSAAYNISKKANKSNDPMTKLLSAKQLSVVEEKATKRPIIDGLKATPLTNQEKAQCSKSLTSQELRQVVIGPPSVDFGQVCLRSVNSRDLTIANNLDQCVHVAVNVDCRELRQTSPLTQVVPPNSKAILPLIFESNTKGRFQR